MHAHDSCTQLDVFTHRNATHEHACMQQLDDARMQQSDDASPTAGLYISTYALYPSGCPARACLVPCNTKRCGAHSHLSRSCSPTLALRSPLPPPPH
eukprot:358487-Chlamydomonas_euryale.AAC.16